MGIKQDADCTWSASYSKRHPMWKVPFSLNRKKLASKAEATRVYGELVIAVNQKIAEKTAPTWRRVVKDHLEQRRLNGYTQKTLYSETVCIRKYTQQWDNRYIDTIKTVEIFDVLNTMSNGSSGNKMFILKCIRGVFTYAVDCGQINRNPTPKIKFKIPNKIMPFLTEPQMIHLLTQAREMNNEWYPVWACAVFLGMRTGELFALKKT
jgi:integrase